MWNWLKKQYNKFVAFMVKIVNFFSNSDSSPKTQEQSSSSDNLSSSAKKMADSGLKNKSNKNQDSKSDVATSSVEEKNLTPLENSIKLMNEQNKLINQKRAKHKGIFNPHGMYEGYSQDVNKLNEYKNDIEFMQRQAKFAEKPSPTGETPSPR